MQLGVPARGCHHSRRTGLSILTQSRQHTPAQPVQVPFSQETRFCEVDNKYHHTLQTGSWAHFPAIALSSLVASTLLLPLLFLLLLGFLFCSSVSASPPYYSPSTSFCIYRQSSSFQNFGFSRKHLRHPFDPGLSSQVRVMT